MKVYMEGTSEAKDIRPGMYIGDTHASPDGWGLVTLVQFREQEPEVSITFEHMNFAGGRRIIRKRPTCPLIVAVGLDAEVFPDGFEFERVDKVVV